MYKYLSKPFLANVMSLFDRRVETNKHMIQLDFIIISRPPSLILSLEIRRGKWTKIRVKYMEWLQTVLKKEPTN